MQDRDTTKKRNIDDGKDKVVMRPFAFIGTVFAFVFMANLAYAKTVEIEMLNKDGAGRKMVYSEELVHVDVGDIVKWLPTSKGHNVEIVATQRDLIFQRSQRTVRKCLSNLLCQTFIITGVHHTKEWV